MTQLQLTQEPVLSCSDTGLRDSRDRLQVLRQQLIHVRTKHDGFIQKRRDHLASALRRLRKRQNRMLQNLEQRAKQEVLAVITAKLSQEISAASVEYLEQTVDSLRKVLSDFFLEERAALTEKLVERVLALAERLPPGSSWTVYLNPSDISALPGTPPCFIKCSEGVGEGCAVLTTDQGEIFFDWYSPLMESLAQNEAALVRRRGAPEDRRADV